jgi:HK97 family phage major capsid protein
MNGLTVTPIMVALLLGLALQPALPIFKINAWNVGIMKVEIWRMRAGVSIARDMAVAATSWFRSLWQARGWRFALAGVALALLVADLSHAQASGLVLATTAAAPDFTEVKKAVDEGNRLFEEFKKTNDERLKQLEARGVVDPLLTEKIEKLNAAIEKQSAINEQFIEARTVLNRLEKGGVPSGDATEKRAAAIRDFNRSLKSVASMHSKAAPADLSEAEYDGYRAAFDRYLRSGDRNLFEAERKALSVGADPNGGWVVTPDLSGKVVQRIFETSPMRQYAASQAISTDALGGAADLDEASFGWVGETGSRSETDTPDVPAPWKIPVHEAYAEPKVTQKMVEDANINIVDWLGRKVGDKIGRGFNAAFVTGDGVSKPRGFATYTTAATADGSRAWGQFEHVLTGTNGGFGANTNGVDKLLDVIHAIKDVYAVRAGFYMNRTTLGVLRQIKDANNQYVFVPSLIAGQADQILGYPVRKIQDMATYSTTGALAIAFGDMEETYLIVDRLGMTTLVDPYTLKGWIKYYTRARVGGDVINFESLKFLKFAA